MLQLCPRLLVLCLHSHSILGSACAHRASSALPAAACTHTVCCGLPAVFGTNTASSALPAPACIHTVCCGLPAAKCTHTAPCALPAEVLQDLLGLLHCLRKYNQMSGLTASSLGAAMGPLLFRPQHSDRAQSSEDIHSWVASAVSAGQAPGMNGAQGLHCCTRPGRAATAEACGSHQLLLSRSGHLLALTPSRGI